MEGKLEAGRTGRVHENLKYCSKQKDGGSETDYWRSERQVIENKEIQEKGEFRIMSRCLESSEEGHRVLHGWTLKETSAWASGKGFLSHRRRRHAEHTRFFGLVWLLCFLELWQPCCTRQGYSSESRLCAQEEQPRGKEPEPPRHHRASEPA